MRRGMPTIGRRLHDWRASIFRRANTIQEPAVMSALRVERQMYIALHPTVAGVIDRDISVTIQRDRI
jgi:hypothetical protein